jgi:hypothetical protein
MRVAKIGPRSASPTKIGVEVGAPSIERAPDGTSIA